MEREVSLLPFAAVHMPAAEYRSWHNTTWWVSGIFPDGRIYGLYPQIYYALGQEKKLLIAVRKVMLLLPLFLRFFCYPLFVVVPRGTGLPGKKKYYYLP